MKFNNATRNLLSEMDMSTTSSMKRNDRLLGGSNSEDMRIRIMRNMGADETVISRWKQAEAKGITFESFLLSLIDEIKDGKINVNNDEINRSVYDDDFGNDDDDDNYGGFVGRRNLKHFKGQE